MVRKIIRLCSIVLTSAAILVFPFTHTAAAGPGSGAVVERDCVAGGGVAQDGVCFGGRWDGAPIYT